MNQSCGFNIFYLKLPEYRLAMCVTSAITTITATFLNSLVLYSIWKTPSLHKPSYLLIANLALTDLIAGSVVQPLSIFKHITTLMNWEAAFCIIWAGGMGTGYWMGAVSLFTIMVISFDRLLAVRLKNRYQTTVTMKRIALVVIVWWIVAGIGVFIPFLFLTSFAIDVFVIMVAVYQFLMLFLLSVSYSLAFHSLKKMSTSVASGTAPSDTARTDNASFSVNRYRKSFNTMLLVVLCVMLFYLPHVVSGLVSGMFLKNRLGFGDDALSVTMFQMLNASEMIVEANSTVNPLLYLWRMQDLRQAAVNTVTKIGRKLSFIKRGNQNHR